MKRWMVAGLIAILMAVEVLLSLVSAGAQPAANDRVATLSPDDQKIAQALFEAQKTGLPPGTTPMTLEHIVALKRAGQGWGELFHRMKEQGLVDAKNLGQVVSAFNHRHRITPAGEPATAGERIQDGRKGAKSGDEGLGPGRGQAAGGVGHGGGQGGGRGR